MRLIDSDELIKEFKEYAQYNGKNIDVNDVLNYINGQPPAYDPDRVVEQMVERQAYYANENPSPLEGGEGLIDQEKIERAIKKLKTTLDCHERCVSGKCKNFEMCPYCELNGIPKNPDEHLENIRLEIFALETVAKIPDVIDWLEMQFSLEKDIAERQQDEGGLWFHRGMQRAIENTLEIIQEKLCGGAE